MIHKHNPSKGCSSFKLKALAFRFFSVTVLTNEGRRRPFPVVLNSNNQGTVISPKLPVPSAPGGSENRDHSWSERKHAVASLQDTQK